MGHGSARGSAAVGRYDDVKKNGRWWRGDYNSGFSKCTSVLSTNGADFYVLNRRFMPNLLQSLNFPELSKYDTVKKTMDSF